MSALGTYTAAKLDLPTSELTSNFELDNAEESPGRKRKRSTNSSAVESESSDEEQCGSHNNDNNSNPSLPFHTVETILPDQPPTSFTPQQRNRSLPGQIVSQSPSSSQHSEDYLQDESHDENNDSSNQWCKPLGSAASTRKPENSVENSPRPSVSSKINDLFLTSVS